MKTTTTFKAMMMAMTFAAFAMAATANTTTKGNTWRNPAPGYKMEVRNDNRHNRHYYADWRTCRHNHLDRYGNKTYCHTCGVEMEWKGNKRNGHFEVIPPRPIATHNHGYGPANTGNHGNGTANTGNHGNGTANNGNHGYGTANNGNHGNGHK